MKRLHLLLTVLSLVLASASAQAERYLLVYKNDQAFSQVHSRWILSTNSLSNRIFSRGGKAEIKGLQVEESLSHVQSVIVEAQDVSALAGIAHSADVLIEKEVFHKSPRPVLNYEPTRAWDFSLQYADRAAHQIMTKKQKKSDEQIQDVSLDQESAGEIAVGPRTPWGIINVKAREAWAESHQGQGSRVLILDTGIDSAHPALRNQIEETKDFVGDHQEPDPVADKVGHGTHVAGTIAGELASDGFSGVAPKAKILAGRVCSEEGCSSISVVRGINWGIEKKVDVINLSLGSDFSNNSEKNAVEKAEKAGIVVVAASGNDGKSTVSFPAAYPTVFAVGAIDNRNIKGDFSQWGPQLDVVAPGVDVESSVPMGTGCASKVSIVSGSANKEANSSCFSGSVYLDKPLMKSLVFVGFGKPQDYQGLDLTDKYALIERGDIVFSEKVENAVAANAAGVVIFNNVPGLMSGSVTEDGSLLAIPVVMIEQVAGQAVKKSLAAGQKVEMNITTERSNFSVYSGTSMACPHTVGVVALVKAANPRLTPEQIRTVIKENTTIISDPIASHANWYGAGAVNAENAVAKAVLLR
jgi:subtilisin family serine protease